MRNNNIAVIGTSYSGLVNALGYADLGNSVSYFDVCGVLDRSRNIQRERLFFPASCAEAIHGAEFVVIAGVPAKDMLTVVESIADALDHPLIIVNKSTVPVGTGDWVAEIIRNRRPDAPEFAVVSCPEFLRKSNAAEDFMNPRRVILGSVDHDTAVLVAEKFYIPYFIPVTITDLRTAEMIKYASSVFLATKVSFVNEITNICKALDADAEIVISSIGEISDYLWELP